MKCSDYLQILIVTFCFAGGCADNANVTIETVEGVQYITNHKPEWGDTPVEMLEFISQFGEIENIKDMGKRAGALPGADGQSV